MAGLQTEQMLHKTYKHTGHGRNKLEMTMKGRRVIIPTKLQSKVLEQLHNNHMGIEKEDFSCEPSSSS